MTFAEVIAQWRSGAAYIPARTSGSTGTPSEIRLPRGLVERSARRTIERFGITAASRLHSCIAPDFIGGKMTAIRAEVAGCRFSFETPSNRPLQEFTPSDALDMVSLVPSQMRYVLDHRDVMPMVKTYLLGGSAIPEAIRRDIAASGLNVYESYGMTETASHIAVRRVGVPQEDFRPLPGVSLSADDRDCLVIDLGADGRIVTNDIVDLAVDGSFRILGRADNVIVTGGKKVHPADVERRLSPLFGDRSICVTSMPDDFWGQRVVLLVEGEEEIPQQVIAKMKKLLEKYEQPKEIVVVKQLLRTENGKIIRKPLD